jgi:hypothetical protein
MPSSTESHTPLNGSAYEHAPPQDITSILLNQSYRVEHSLGRIETTLESHGTRLATLESKPGPALIPSHRARLLTWAAGWVDTPRNARDATYCLGLLTTWVELVFGPLGAVEKLTMAGVKLGGMLLQTPPM